MSYFPRDLTAAVAADPTSGPDLLWEETPCLLCGGRRWQTLLEAPENQVGTGLWFAVVQCDDCGLCFTNPRPTQACIDQFYHGAYKPHLVKAAKEPGWWRRLLRACWPKRAEIPWRGQGRLLDFGCGAGAFLERMRTAGWNATGLDLSEETVLRLQLELGLRVLHGTLPHPELDGEQFDVITMWHSLEHVPDPRQTLRHARKLLAPDGRLYVAVPNIDSLAFRMFGHTWYGLDLPRHLTHFAPWTLHVMLERAGFRVERIRMVRHSSWLRESAQLACKTNQARAVHRWMKGKPLSRLTAFYSCLTGQSDCMLAVATVGDVP